jgi:hypothetical protein
VLHTIFSSIKVTTPHTAGHSPKDITMKQPRTLSYFFSLGDFRVNVRCVVFEEELEIEEVLDSNDVDVFNYLNEEALEDLQKLAEAEAKYDGWLPDPDEVISDDDIALWNHPDGGL